MPKKLTPAGTAAKPPGDNMPPAAAKKKPTRKPRAKKQPTSNAKFIRNIRYMDARLTLDGDRIDLKPRGERGDTKKISEDQFNDPSFEQDYGMIFEVLTEEEAKEVLHKQATNQQVGPTPFDYLVNERGEKYEKPPTVEKPYEQQGTVVAQVEQGNDGRYVQNQERLVREDGAAPQQVAVPGSIGAPLPQVPSDIPAEQVADWVARNHRGDDAGDALRSTLKVEVEPTRRS